MPARRTVLTRAGTVSPRPSRSASSDGRPSLGEGVAGQSKSTPRVAREVAAGDLRAKEQMWRGLGQRLECGETAAAGDDGEALGVALVGLVGAGDDVLQQAVGGDGRAELVVGERVRRGLAHVLRREGELAKRDVPDRRLGRGCDVVHANLRRWMNGRAGDGPLGPARVRPDRARLRLSPACSRSGACGTGPWQTGRGLAWTARKGGFGKIASGRRVGRWAGRGRA